MGYEALVEERSWCVRQLEITPDLVLDLLKVNEHRRVTINGRELSCVEDAIPASATVSSCGISDSGNIRLRVTHHSFSPILPGTRIPRIDPVFQLAEARPEEKPAAWIDEEIECEEAFKRSGAPRDWPDDEPETITRCSRAMADECVRLRAEVEMLRMQGDVLKGITDAFAKQRWIPVEERLPDDGDVVLVCKPDGRAALGYVRDGQWINTLYGWVVQPGPSHWMPLPEPPEATP